MKKLDQWFQKKFKIENINLLHTWYICFIVIGILIIGLCVRNMCPYPGDMYSFSGAVIGGGLTLIGVMITINKQEEQRQEDLAIQYKPIPMISDSLKKDGKDLKPEEPYFIDRFGSYNLKLKNLGRGEAVNVRLELIYDNNLPYIIEFKEDYMKNFDFIVPNNYGISIKINIESKNKSDLKKLFLEQNVKFDIIINYESPFEEKQKKIISSITHKYNDDKINTLVIQNRVE